MKNQIFFLVVSLILCLSNLKAQPVINEHGITFSSSQSATLIGEDGLIMKTTDEGQSWVEQTSGTSNTLFGIDMISQDSGFVVGENGVILITINGGNEWLIKLTSTTEHLRDVKAIVYPESITIIACGDNGTILLSNDFGETWNLINSGTNNNLNDIHFVRPEIGYIVGNNTTILKSVDGGLHWYTIDPQIGYYDLSSIATISDLQFTIIGNNGFIANTLDGGNTFNTPQTLSYNDKLNEIIYFENSTTGIIAGDNGVLLRTTDAGQSWYNSSFLSDFKLAHYDLNSVAFSTPTKGISVGYPGIELYTNDGGETWYDTYQTKKASGKINSDAGKNTNISNYPNPFNPNTIITYFVPNDADISLKVYDITGKLVSTLVENHQTTGKYSVMFNGSDLSSGVYFYKLEIVKNHKRYMKTSRMLLAK